ncbi:hypothetical protein FRC12_002690 [Ceratobasidium sp. 428]|nr:hypothetical protein FRC12_002690 [Ceratobasidium sp. 428]
MSTTDSESEYESDVILDEDQLTDSDSVYETDDEDEIDPITEQNEPQSPSGCEKLPNKKRKRQMYESSSSSKTRSATGPDHKAPKREPTENKSALLDLFENLIESLTALNTSFSDFLLFVFNPKRRGDTKSLRHQQFWAHEKKVKKLLRYWSHSHQSDPGRHIFLEWIHKYVGRELRAEARKVTASGELRTTEDRIEPEYLHNKFKISSVIETVTKSCPLTVRMMLDFVTPKGARKKLNELSRVKQTAIMSAVTILLRQHSRLNNIFQTHLGLYMFGIGLQRQGYDILSHVGTLTSYTNLVRGKSDPNSIRSESRKPEKKKKTNPQSNRTSTLKAPSEQSNGAVKMLSTGCRKLTKRRWKERRHGIIFDNFNFLLKAAQQILGRTDSQENGTCATIFELHKATPEALDHSAARAAFAQAQPLQPDHILHSETESDTHRKLMVHAIVRIILKYGGEEFKQYGPLLDKSQPIVLPVIDVHTSNFYPLPAMDIDESSIDGVIKVFEAIFKELEIDTNAEEFDTRIGQEEPKSSLSNLEYILGLFHTKMTAVVSILNTHLGSSTAGQDAPGSLFFHNSILERKAFVATSLPPFAVAKDLIMDSLAARIIHCLLRVSSCKDIEAYLARLGSCDSAPRTSTATDKSSWEQLLRDAEELYDTYVNTSHASELQSDRLYADPNTKAGDMVYEGAVFFLRDALNLEELFDAVKCGHSGRILSVLKLFALSFRGSDRPQYARALLRLIHYCEVVWPPKLR